MRPQQQNRRMRGRGNNRKGPNPLTRSYESNGPDVKIRGTAQQIADKYTALARDAQSSGDRVMAENYLQHAEHYNRLIAAAQAQMQPQQVVRESREDTDDDFDGREEQEAFGFPSHPRPPVNDGSGPQPVIDGMPAEVAFKDRQLNGANGSAPNGRENTGNGQAAKQEPEAAPAEEAAEAAAGESPEPAAKPARRTRRPRAKRTEEAAAAENS